MPAAVAFDADSIVLLASVHSAQWGRNDRAATQADVCVTVAKCATVLDVKHAIELQSGGTWPSANQRCRPLLPSRGPLSSSCPRLVINRVAPVSDLAPADAQAWQVAKAPSDPLTPPPSAPPDP